MQMLPACRVVALGIIAISILTAQKPAPPVPTPSKGSAPTATAPSQPSDNSNTPWPESQIPVTLFGTVVKEGGGEPAFNIAIQRFCGNLTHTVAWTDAKGRFSFQWNDYSGVTLDASDPEPNLAAISDNTSSSNSHKLPGVSMLGCQLQADAPGFRSDRIELGERRALDNPDLGIMVLHRTVRTEGISVSASGLNASKNARKALERGEQLLHSDQQSDQAEAEQEFEKAVRIDPKFAEAWVALGHARERRLAEDKACEAFQRAIAADNGQADAFIALGMVASRRAQWPEAAQYLDRALQLNPIDYPHLWYDDALADYHAGKLDRAEKTVREAVKVPPPNRELGALRLLGLVLMTKHDYPGAEAALTAYLAQTPDIDDLVETREKLEEVREHLRAEP